MAVLRSFDLYEALLKDTNEAFQGRAGTTKQVAATAIRNSFLKKFRDGSSDSANAKAISKFLLINDKCESWRRDVKSSLFIEKLVGHMKVALHKFFEPNNRGPLVTCVEQILDHAYTGPGAAIGAKLGDFYTKLFSSDLSCTSPFLYAAYARYIQKFDHWHAAELARQSAGLTANIVKGNRVSCVPKNVDISRTTCIEPNLNMFFQLGLGSILTDRLKEVYSIDISKQSGVNGELARIGSLDDNLCTIDLESASDSMSLSMLRYMLPSSIFSWLSMFRSKETTLPSGETRELHMVGTMGNGFTFPLQTILFSCAISACNSYLGRKSDARAGVTWSVYGDDIIVHREIVAPLLDLLDFLGFTVNAEKSFFEGPFRESCGLDFFNGSNVRGVYVKSLRTPQLRCALINVLNRWSAQTGISLPETVKALLRTVRYKPVPPWENDDAGVKVPFSLVPGMRRSKRYQSILYSRYVSQPRTIKFFSDGVKYPSGVRPIFRNESGLLMAMLQGTLVDGKINVRHNVSLYRNTTGVAPNWDYSYTASKEILDNLLRISSVGSQWNLDRLIDGLRDTVIQRGDLNWQRWRTAVESNLLGLTDVE